MNWGIKALILLAVVTALAIGGSDFAESKFKSSGKNASGKGKGDPFPGMPDDGGDNGIEGNQPGITPIIGEMQQHTETQYKKDDAGDFDPDVSPDGKWLIYSTTTNSNERQLFLKKVDGKTMTALTEPGYSCMHPKFHPGFDGKKNKKITFASNASGNSWDIWVMEDVDKGFKSAYQITHTEENECHPSWSPDGSKIVYSGWDSMKKDYMLFIIDIETEQKHPLNIDGLFPEWCPSIDKSKKDLIVFQRARRRGVRWFSLWTIYADGTRRRILIPSNDDWAAITPSWSPDGNWIVFTTVHESKQAKKERRIFGGDDIWAIKLDGTMRTRFTNDPSVESSPCWANKVGAKGENGRIFFCSKRTGFRNIWSLMPYLKFKETDVDVIEEDSDTTPESDEDAQIPEKIPASEKEEIVSGEDIKAKAIRILSGPITEPSKAKETKESTSYEKK